MKKAEAEKFLNLDLLFFLDLNLNLLLGDYQGVFNRPYCS